MYQMIQDSTRNLPDVSAFIETIKSARDLFDGDTEIFVTRAPGRLDIMDGIADYSGSLVLEMPIAEAALVALQKRNPRVLKIKSLRGEANDRTHFFEMSLAEFEPDGKITSYEDVRERFKRDAANDWAAYIAGAFLVLMREKNARFECGVTILIDSKVPEGKGVSSSAAIEVATMNAIATTFEIEIEPRELAILCQKVENLVVGAPCGIMDQMSSACGEANQLLSIICQPAELRGTVEIPANLTVWGIDSGIRHSVGAGDYGSVRTGAFMGYRIIAELVDLKVSQTKIPGVVEIADEKWSGYLANISPEEFAQTFAAHLPREIYGAEFLDKYQGITDTATRVSPEKAYQILYPTAHPVYENARVQQYAKLLSAPLNEDNLHALGKLMYESHESYSACGLGTDGTDLLIELVKKSRKLYGAKITGGGSGGTVAVLGEKGADAEIEKVVAAYERQRNYCSYIFKGSSLGAAEFGHLKL